MKKLFTLIELIVVIVVLGILAAIVIPNISSFKEEAIKTEVVANTTNLQTVTDLYALKNNGDVPTKAKPTIGNPTRIDLDELYPKYIRDKEFKHGYYWIDYTGKVWGSTIDAPRGLAYKDDTVSFEAVNNAIEYELFGYGEQGVQGAANGQSARSLENIVVDKPIKIVTKKLPLEKQSEGYLISAIDQFGLPTAPVGKMYDGYDSIFPISESFNLVTNAHGQADWLGLFTIEEKPGNSKINYAFETSNNGVDYVPVVGGIENAPDSQYLKVKVEMVASNGQYPTIHKLKVQFKLAGEEYVEVDLVADRTLAEGTKDQLGDIVLEDNVSEGRTEHVVELPSEKFVDDVILIGEIPEDGSIETSYQSSKDGVTWSEEVLHPEELPEGTYVKIINEITRETTSPTIEKIIIKTTDEDPNTGPVPPPVVEEEPVTEPQWVSILNFNIIEDATNVGDWISVDIVDIKPENTRIVYEYYTSNDETNWTKYDTVEEAPNSRYLKVAVKYERLKDTTNTPKLMEMTINYKMQDGTTKSSIKYKDGIEYVAPAFGNVSERIGVGANSTYFITDEKTVKSVGHNNYGELGNGTTNQSVATTSFVDVIGLTNVKQVSGGTQYALALLEDGTVKAWGWNSYNQLGDGTDISRTTPVTVPNLTNVKKVIATNYTSYALLNDGTVKAWGQNWSGDTGVGHSNIVNVPTTVPGLTNVKDLVAGRGFALALLNDGTLKNWGDNMFNQLGDGTTKNSNLPKTVSGVSNVKQIAASGFHSLALVNENEVWGWGDGYSKQLGLTIYNTVGRVSSPMIVPEFKNVKEIHAGYSSTFIVKSDNTLVTTGSNTQGILGDTTVDPTTGLTSPKDLGTIKSVVLAHDNAFALTTDNKIVGWGHNYYGQTGIGYSQNKLFYPEVIPALNNQ